MQQNALLNLFSNDKSRTDMLCMPDFFETLCKNTRFMLHESSASESFSFSDVANIAGMTASLGNMGYALSENSIYVADLPDEITKGLQNGTYIFGKSQKGPGEFAATIYRYNEEGKKVLVGQVTLKKAFDPSKVLSNIATLSMQIALQEISSELRSIHEDLKHVIATMKNENIDNRFFNARDKILQAANESEESTQQGLLNDADTYLMEGWNTLRSDTGEQIKKLAGYYDGPFAKLRRCFARDETFDSILSNIHEDLQKMHRFIGLRAYLFNYRGKPEQVARVLDEYSAFLHELDCRVFNGRESSAWELINANAQPYQGRSNFWLEEPKKLMNDLDSCQTFLKQKDKDVILIGVEQ